MDEVPTETLDLLLDESEPLIHQVEALLHPHQELRQLVIARHAQHANRQEPRPQSLTATWAWAGVASAAEQAETAATAPVRSMRMELAFRRRSPPDEDHIPL